VKGRVVRCQVSAIGGGGSLQYQSAITFEANIELPLDEAPKADATAEPAPSAASKQASTPEPKGQRLKNRW
jgi:hypothetical protein